MTIEVPKVIGGVVLGTPATGIVVTKVVGFVIYDTNSPAPTAPQVRKKVAVRGRIIYT